MTWLPYRAWGDGAWGLCQQDLQKRGAGSVCNRCCKIQGFC
jgi:hypothetical protein